jgi:hypothetical protein
MDRVVDLTWISAFPHEREFLFSPLTYMQSVRDEPIIVKIGAVTYKVFEVKAQMWRVEGGGEGRRRRRRRRKRVLRGGVRRIFVFAPNKDHKSVGKQEEEDELELNSASGSV